MYRICTLVIFFISGFSFGQDPVLQHNNPILEKEAFEITETYNKELALDGKQIILFEKKVEEFLIRRKKIESDYSGTAKLNTLLNMQTQETLEMNDILTRPQLTIYKKIKPNIQPLAIVK